VALISLIHNLKRIAPISRITEKNDLVIPSREITWHHNVPTPGQNAKTLGQRFVKEQHAELDVAQHDLAYRVRNLRRGVAHIPYDGLGGAFGPDVACGGLEHGRNEDVSLFKEDGGCGGECGEEREEGQCG